MVNVFPLHVNAPGKAIVASLDSRRVADLLDERELVAPTAETLTDPDSLAVELENVRESAIAFCRGEQFEGVVGVAAPIGLDERGPAAAIGLCGPRERLAGRYLEEDITGQVISAAKSVQANLTKRVE